MSSSRKNETPKTRNNGLWTESRFKGFVTSALRGSMRRWPPKWEALKKAFIGVKINKKSKRKAKHYKCSLCEKEFTSTNIQIDHKDPIGTCNSWDLFIEKLFCEVENLQAVCKTCHKIKTKKEQAN